MINIAIQDPRKEEPTDEEFIYAPFAHSEEDDGAEDTPEVIEATIEEEQNADKATEDIPASPQAYITPDGNIVMSGEENLDPELAEETDATLQEELVEEETVPKEEYDLLKDRYERLMSDWENYRRRSAEEVANAKASANKNLAEALIPTFDHFGYALSHARSMGDNPAAAEMAKGFEAIYRAMLDQLGREGLEVIAPAMGTPLDMMENQAIERREVEGAAPDTIAEVKQVGYKFNGYVIRPALVVVAS